MATRRGTIRAAVVKGDAPLLLSRPSLKAVNTKVDFGGDSLRLFGSSKAGPVDVPLSCNSAGQHVISVVDFPESPSESSCMASAAEHPKPECDLAGSSPGRRKKQDYCEVKLSQRLVIRQHVNPRRSPSDPSHSQCPVPISALG